MKKSKITIKAEGVILTGDQFDTLQQHFTKLRSALGYEVEITFEGFVANYGEKEINIIR